MYKSCFEEGFWYVGVVFVEFPIRFCGTFQFMKFCVKFIICKCGELFVQGADELLGVGCVGVDLDVVASGSGFSYS